MGRSDRWMDCCCHDGAGVAARLEVTELAEHMVDFSAHLGETGQCRPGFFVGLERDVQLLEFLSIAQPNEFVSHLAEPSSLEPFPCAPCADVPEVDREGDIPRLRQERPHSTAHVLRQLRVELLLRGCRRVEIRAAAREPDEELGVFVEHGCGFGVDGAACAQESDVCILDMDFVVVVYPLPWARGVNVDLARREDVLVDEEAEFVGQLEEVTAGLCVEIVGHCGFACEVAGWRR